MSALFFSELPCYLKIDGNFVGEIDKNPKIFNSLSCDSFLEFIPKNSEYYSISTLYRDKLNVKCFNLKGDDIIVPLFYKKRSLSYSVLFQEKLNVYNSEVILTVVQDGGYKLYLDGIIVYTDSLPFSPQRFEFKVIKNALILIFYGKKTVVIVLDLNNGKLLFKNMGDKVNIDGFLCIENTYKTAIPLTITDKWDLTSFKLLEKTSCPHKSRFQIHPKLISTAFFEWIALNVSVKELLSSEILSREQELSSFIGKPIAVFPYYKDINKTVVLDNESAHLYTLEFKDNLIFNIIEE